MLDMLCKLLQQQGVASNLCSLGIVPALELLQESHSTDVRRHANKTLTALMQSEPSAQPFSPNHSSGNIPRSRCQSNSPIVFETKHQQQRSCKGSGSHANAMYGMAVPQSCGRDSLELASQAFGSQQGAAALQLATNKSQQAKLGLLCSPSCQTTALLLWHDCAGPVVQRCFPLVAISASHQGRQVARLQQAMKLQLVCSLGHNGGSSRRQQSRLRPLNRDGLYQQSL